MNFVDVSVIDGVLPVVFADGGYLKTNTLSEGKKPIIRKEKGDSAANFA